jgi:hypothetical protein
MLSLKRNRNSKYESGEKSRQNTKNNKLIYTVERITIKKVHEV